ncbi:MAG: NAD-dependent epimerase/dehydratase family protein [Rhodospirillales bacterium]|nr:NAD-dependent epimerase/dehydratase family protein [Rhodospirillales bacterium]
MRALITGGAGFIGVHLARRLVAEGLEVDLVDDFSRGRRDADLTALTESRGVSCIGRDLLQPGSLDELPNDYGLIFHLAAIVGVANVTAQPFAVLRRNLELFFAVLDFAQRQRRLGRLVFASTSEVYAGTAGHLELPLPTPEDVPIALPDLAGPRASYLLSKLYGEALCHHAELPATVIRPHNVYGPRMGMAHVIPELFERALRTPEGGRVTVYSPGHRRAFCHVADAVELIARLAQAEAAEGGVFNVGNGDEEIAIGDLAERIVAIAGRRVALEAGRETPGSPRRRCPDMTRTQSVTGFRPRVGLDQGLRETWAWYRDQLLEADEAKAS